MQQPCNNPIGEIQQRAVNGRQVVKFRLSSVNKGRFISVAVDHRTAMAAMDCGPQVRRAPPLAHKQLHRHVGLSFRQFSSGDWLAEFDSSSGRILVLRQAHSCVRFRSIRDVFDGRLLRRALSAPSIRFHRLPFSLSQQHLIFVPRIKRVGGLACRSVTSIE